MYDIWLLWMKYLSSHYDLSQLPHIMWASGCWHHERTLYSRRPFNEPEFLSIIFTLQLNTNSVAHKNHDIRNQRDAHNSNIQVNI